MSIIQFPLGIASFPFHSLKTLLGVIAFKARGSGHIINIGSVAGRDFYPGGSIYCGTKAAVRAFTGALIRELVDTPIRVTEIQPGMVETSKLLSYHLPRSDYLTLHTLEDFSVTRFRGDKSAADKVYEGIQPRKRKNTMTLVTR